MSLKTNQTRRTLKDLVNFTIFYMFCWCIFEVRVRFFLLSISGSCLILTDTCATELTSQVSRKKVLSLMVSSLLSKGKSSLPACNTAADLVTFRLTPHYDDTDCKEGESLIHSIVKTGVWKTHQKFSMEVQMPQRQRDHTTMMKIKTNGHSYLETHGPVHEIEI